MRFSGELQNTKRNVRVNLKINKICRKRSTWEIIRISNHNVIKIQLQFGIVLAAKNMFLTSGKCADKLHRELKVLFKKVSHACNEFKRLNCSSFIF